MFSRIKQTVKRTIQRTTNPATRGTDPAAVFIRGPVPSEVKQFCTSALHEVVSISQAEKLVNELNAEAYTLKGKRGIIGALAALGYSSQQDHTYEIIAYRTKKNLGKPRRVDPESVKRMDQKRQLCTFNNVDPETGRVLTCPHGPDPVLIGIRGEDPTGLVSAYSMIKLEEPVERVMMFKTNQGTDAHFSQPSQIHNLSVHQSAVLTGQVVSRPKTLRGGHVIFQLEDPTGKVDCAAYQPTGQFRNIIRDLAPDDTIRIFGGVREGPNHRLTVNLEKLEVLRLTDDVRYLRPRCDRCGSSCESMGRDQGFRCRRCGRRFPRGTLIRSVRPRRLRETFYLPPPRAHRHLTKPQQRYNITVDSLKVGTREGPSYAHSLLTQPQPMATS